MDRVKGMLKASTLLQVMVFLLEQRCPTGVSLVREVIQPELVSVRRGESVTLNCTFIHNATEGAWVHVYWHRTSPGTDDDSYKMTNSQCIPDVHLGGFRHCTVSLKTERVSFRHSVYNYTCEVRIPNAYPPIHVKGQGTQLQISVPESPPEILITHEDLIAEKASVLYCHAWGFYPQNISMKWLHPHNAQALEAHVKITTRLSPFRNSDGTFNATSQMNFTPTVQDHRTICSCQILHTTSKEWIIKHITLNVNYGPRPIIYYRNSISDHFQPLDQDTIYIAPQSYLQLNCTTDSNPVSTVIWMKSGGHTERIQLAIGLSNSVLQKENIDDSYSGKYICRAYNAFGSKEHPVIIYITSHWKSHFSVRFVTVPIFVVTIFSLLLWSNKDRHFSCKWRNRKQHKKQCKSVKSDTSEDVDSKKDKITTSEF